MYRRNLEGAVRAALADTPVVFLAGPRQVGKSTLARAIGDGERPPRRYLTLDDVATFAAAHADPQGFVEGLDGRVTLDEVQRVPELFRALKLAVDREGERRTPGRFLLTGSADPLLVPAISESLAGRIEILTLWGLSQGELADGEDRLVDRLFEEAPEAAITGGGESRPELLARGLAGGYPEVLARRDPGRRRDWLAAYVAALLARDVRELARVEGLALFPRLMALLAARSGSSLNAADLGRDAGLAYATLRRYLALLEAVHLVRFLPPWAKSETTRLVKAPKVLVTDSALAAHLAGWSVAGRDQDPRGAGPLLETFVGGELLRQLGWSRTRARLLWFRTSTGREVDYVLEADDGRLVGIEVKAGATIGAADFSGLETLRELAGERFHRGLLLYAGREALPFGERLAAAPLGCLWAPAPRRVPRSRREPKGRKVGAPATSRG